MLMLEFIKAVQNGDWAMLKVESKQNADVEKNLSSKHYELTNAARTKVIVSALSLTTTLQGFTNPFVYDDDDYQYCVKNSSSC